MRDICPSTQQTCSPSAECLPGAQLQRAAAQWCYVTRSSLEFRDYHQNFHHSGLTPKSAELGDTVLTGESGCQAKSRRLDSDGASSAFLRGKSVRWYCALHELFRKSKRCGKHIRVAAWRAQPPCGCFTSWATCDKVPPSRADKQRSPTGRPPACCSALAQTS